MLTAPSALPSPSLVTGSCALTPPSPYVSCGQIWPRWHAWAESASAAAHQLASEQWWVDTATVGRHAQRHNTSWLRACRLFFSSSLFDEPFELLLFI